MTVLAGIGFTAPWLMLGLVALPILWLLLRAIPPAPVRRLFPAVTLLLGLRDDESVSDRTPWWLLLLRTLAIAAAIVGLAGPVLNPSTEDVGDGPLLIVLDSSWAGAGRWQDQTRMLAKQLTEAGRASRPVAVLELTSPDVPQFQSADTWRSRIAGLAPRPWQPSAAQANAALTALEQIDGGFDSLWFADGLDFEGREALTDMLMTRGDLKVVQTGRQVLGLLPARFEDGSVHVALRWSDRVGAREYSVVAQGLDPGGTARVLAAVPARFEDGSTIAEATLTLPAELRSRVTRFEIQGQESAGAVSLTDDSLRRREVALIAGREDREGLELLSPLHYLRQALVPTADLLDGSLTAVIPANPDVIVLADVATLSGGEEQLLTEWVEAGGMLLRFAGPRLAASDIARAEGHPLMPVRLRSGGRSVGGAMSWGQPKELAPFAEGSPFFGLRISDEVRVNSQVVAQPDPNLAARVIAELGDGTPLVTRKELGQGQVVLFHVTANAEWSSLPLSGLFVEMLERLAVSASGQTPDAADLEGTTWTPVQVLDGFGTLKDAGNLPGVDGPDLASSPPGPNLQPGLYESGDRKLARNVLGPDDILTPATWPASVPVLGLTVAAEVPLAGLLLSLALILLALDVIVSLLLSGRIGQMRGLAIWVAALSVASPQTGWSQDPTRAIEAANEMALAHVLTGNKQVDEIAQAGLRGLSETLFFRTSVEPADPISVDLERDELAFFPILYWPVTPDQPLPSIEAYTRLNTYLRSGGMILFDTRDANIAGFGTSSPNGRKLQQLARSLDVPPLEPVPGDHVLTRAFYLLQDFPGRHAGRDVWVEAAPPDAELVEGMPFRNLNDGVTPVVIGGNDWAAAWATNTNGQALLPVGRGHAGDRQRELAYRFGVNLVMHVLTGNYKSDQVHVPALLNRLGQ